MATAAAGGGLAGALGGGAAKSLGASAALKGAATVAVVAAIGVGAADRGGLIDVGLPGDGGSQATRVERPAGAGPARAQPSAFGLGRDRRHGGSGRKGKGRRPPRRLPGRKARRCGRRRPPTAPRPSAEAVRCLPRQRRRPPSRQGTRKAASQRLRARAADGGKPQSRRPRIRRDATPRTRRSRPIPPILRIPAPKEGPRRPRPAPPRPKRTLTATRPRRPPAPKKPLRNTKPARSPEATAADRA